MIDDITVCIPTFERPHCLERLLSSIRRFYPDIKVIVADNGQQRPAREVSEKYKAEYHLLPFDVGLSATRNHLTKVANTHLIFYVDDDMEFIKETDLETLKHLFKISNAHILAIGMKNPDSLKTVLYAGRLVIRDKILYRDCKPYGLLNGCVNVTHFDVVQNVFLATKEKILSILWDERLKMAELMDFFLRAKGMNVRVGGTKNVVINHWPVGHDSENEDSYYKKFYDRSKNEFTILANRIIGVISRENKKFQDWI
jgi:glycosyltransferase involved in cell wall biosynthesis